MLDGHRGYWGGKKRDNHTIARLAESKYKKIVEYDHSGNFVKIWDSAKEIAITKFNDYKVVNGSADSKIYVLISNKTIKKHFYQNSYWYKATDLIKEFNVIPKKLNIDAIIQYEKNIRKEKRKSVIKTHKYTVIQYDNNGNKINDFLNVLDASKKLKIGEHTVRKMCRGKKISNKPYILKYGEKKLQPTIYTKDHENI
jgi:hypothetical protein